MPLTCVFPRPVAFDAVQPGAFILATLRGAEVFGLVCAVQYGTSLLILRDAGGGLTPRLEGLRQIDGAARVVEGDLRLEPLDGGVGEAWTDGDRPHGLLRLLDDGDCRLMLRDPDHGVSWVSLMSADYAPLGPRPVRVDHARWRISLASRDGPQAERTILARHDPPLVAGPPVAASGLGAQ